MSGHSLILLFVLSSLQLLTVVLGLGVLDGGLDNTVTDNFSRLHEKVRQARSTKIYASPSTLTLLRNLERQANEFDVLSNLVGCNTSYPGQCLSASDLDTTPLLREVRDWLRIHTEYVARFFLDKRLTDIITFTSSIEDADLCLGRCSEKPYQQTSQGLHFKVPWSRQKDWPQCHTITAYFEMQQGDPNAMHCTTVIPYFHSIYTPEEVAPKKVLNTFCL